MSYDPIEFAFQVHNDAKVTETAYLCPEELPYGATLEVSPIQADVPSGEAVIFKCRLTLDEAIIRPGCTNDQGFRITAWRVADDSDERWGSCFYHLRPRIRTKVSVERASWYETQIGVYGQLRLDTDQPVKLEDQLPLHVRLRLEYDEDGEPLVQWFSAQVQPTGLFRVQRKDFKGPPDAKLRIQAWFDRTGLLGSSRSDIMTCRHETFPVPG
jgi:hypothetical protein